MTEDIARKASMSWAEAVRPGRPRQVSELVKKGYSPSRIARETNLNISSVKGYLWRAVGEGYIALADIVFAITPSTRGRIEVLLRKHGVTSRRSILEGIKNSRHLNADDAEIYFNLRRAVYGDLYGLLHEIELDLHKAIKEGLSAEYGEKNWWDSGVAKGVRDKCEGRAKFDGIDRGKDTLYGYTSLSELRTILQDQWPVVSRYFPHKLVFDRDKFFLDLKRLTKLRNDVMHPVKGYLPTKEDYDFALGFSACLKGSGS